MLLRDYYLQVNLRGFAKLLNIQLELKLEFKFNLKRDCVCIARLLIDSIPYRIRNSRLLFEIARLLFGLPSSLFYFREYYENDKIKDLSVYYSSNDYSLERLSKKTDINSFHLRIIKNIFKSLSPFSVLDAGCGSGYLLDQLRLIKPNINLLGIDYKIPQRNDSKISFLEGDILYNLKNMSNNLFEFVICSHVIEHLNYPDEVLLELRRVCSDVLIIICPIERRYKWGMNYHVNFYPTKKSFINFCLPDFDEKNKILEKFKYFYRLGDLMYVEYIDKNNISF